MTGTSASAAQASLGDSSSAAASSGRLTMAQKQAKVAAANVEPSLTTQDAAILSSLTASLNDPGAAGSLSALTGLDFNSSNPPDFLAVRSGANVTPQLAGGYSVAGSVDQYGNNIMWFGSGAQPNAYKAAAIVYGQGTTPTQHSETRKFAMSYLSDHLSDKQDAGGAWNQPLFDGTA
jgi:hypothetical protein